MRILIDTNIWIYACTGAHSAVELLHLSTEAEWAGYSSITRLELFGFPGLTSEQEKQLTGILDEFAEVYISSPIIDTAILIRKKHRIKVPDAIIAASATVTNSSLATRNVKDFAGIDNLTLIDPFSEPSKGRH